MKSQLTAEEPRDIPLIGSADEIAALQDDGVFFTLRQEST